MGFKYTGYSQQTQPSGMGPAPIVSDIEHKKAVMKGSYLATALFIYLEKGLKINDHNIIKKYFDKIDTLKNFPDFDNDWRDFEIEIFTNIIHKERKEKLIKINNERANTKV